MGNRVLGQRLWCSPAVAPLLAAIDTLRAMNRRNARKCPTITDWFPASALETPRPHRGRCGSRVHELAVLTELKNGSRAGDVWVPGSRQSHASKRIRRGESVSPSCKTRRLSQSRSR